MNVQKIREDFTILRNNPDIAYFDNAATSLTPDCVIEKEREYYEQYNANIHRGLHRFTQKASEEWENAHEKVAKFIGARPNQVMFVKNATEGLNYISNIVSGLATEKKPKVVITDIEHHSNFVPWLRLRERGLINLDFIRVSKQGTVDMDQVKDACKNASILSVTHVSNVMGNIMPLRDIIGIAKDNNALVSIDAAQSVPHMPVSVKDLKCDFLAFSGHKMLGPTGIGVLYVKDTDSLEPLMLGGGTISDVRLDGYGLAQAPDRFEAGTPNIAGGIALGRAVEYLTRIGMKNVLMYEEKLTKIILDHFKGTKIDYIGPWDMKQKSAVISFNVPGIDAHDVATLLDQKKVFVRSGHHCCLPLMHKFSIPGTARASLYVYNTEDEVKRFLEVVDLILETFS
jgi:cysteine desulfurase/selenocysteine lyase